MEEGVNNNPIYKRGRCKQHLGTISYSYIYYNFLVNFYLPLAKICITQY